MLVVVDGMKVIRIGIMHIPRSGSNLNPKVAFEIALDVVAAHIQASIIPLQLKISDR